MLSSTAHGITNYAIMNILRLGISSVAQREGGREGGDLFILAHFSNAESAVIFNLSVCQFVCIQKSHNTSCDTEPELCSLPPTPFLNGYNEGGGGR